MVDVIEYIAEADVIVTFVVGIVVGAGAAYLVGGDFLRNLMNKDGK